MMTQDTAKGSDTLIRLPLAATQRATRDRSEDITFRSGPARLAGTLHQPTLRAPEAVVVLCGATGVPHRYYHAFADWLATERGFACLSFDYRDFAASAERPARTSTATMVDWGLHDAYAARLEAQRRFPGLPLWMIGHSLGGLLVPFQPDPGGIDRVITVASGLVHSSDHPLHYRPTVYAFWHLMGPLMATLLGRIPGRAFGMGSDLPASVFWQWRRWCTTRGFYAQDFGRDLPMPNGSAFTGSARFVAVGDDVMIPPEAAWRLMAVYDGAVKEQVTLDPAQFGLGRIGHISAFHTRNAAIWSEILGLP